jgi:hypothetical protein
MARLHQNQTAAGEQPDPQAVLDALRNVAPYLPQLPEAHTPGI